MEKRTLIEKFLPVEEISEEAKIEKSGNAKPPMFSLHYWWTRKPLVASRATVLGALLPEDFDIDEFKQFLQLGKIKRAHNYNLSSSQIDKLKQKYKDVWGTETPTILDPFAGGGSIPFEALRVGCNAIANDYNTVAYLILKATLEYPAIYEQLIRDVENGMDWIFDKTKEELQEFYPKHNGKDVVAYIYAWVASCPSCGFKNPLVGQWWLVRKNKKKLYLEPTVEDNDLKLKIKSGNKAPEGTMVGGKGRCLKCGKVIPDDHIKKEIFEKEEELLLAVVLKGSKGKEYDLPNDDDLKAIDRSKKVLSKLWDEFLKDDLIPIEEIPDDDRGGMWAKLYLKNWYRILNPRQILLFATLLKQIRGYIELIKKKKGEEYAKAIGTLLSFILGKHIDHNCRSVNWNRPNEQVSHVLAARGIPMMWDHAEVNPFVKGSGTLPGMIKNIRDGLIYSVQKLEDNNGIKIKNKSITALDSEVDIIVTDPPYLDDVVYAEFSEFFYVWEKRALKGLMNIPVQIQKTEDLSVGGQGRTNEFFEHLFKISCKKMYDILTDDGILVMYFAHSSVDAWDFVVNALRNAGFKISATWPIHTEFKGSLITQGHASIMSSIIIVARKRKEEKTGYIEEIREDVETHLRKRLQEFWDYGLRGADLTVSAMGATLDILTQYSEIKSYTGEMTIKDVLELVQSYVAQFVLEKFIGRAEGLDGATAFYAYCRLSELDGMPFDTANLISKSLNLNLKELERNGIVESIKKGKTKGIKLLRYNEREKIEVRTLIDAVHACMFAFEKGGLKEVEAAFNEMPYSRAEIKNVLQAFQYLKSGDPERQIALQILGKAAEALPAEGQYTLDDKKWA